jgi:isocitrate/isopropylmalate dehydrogenase
MMLKHIGKSSFAVALEQAVIQTLSKARNRTKDMGGALKTNEFADEIINNVKDELI